ncbi:MAG: ATP-binding protein [Chloroflexota bacterium]
MDAFALPFIALQAIVIALVVGIALARGRTIEAVSEGLADRGLDGLRRRGPDDLIDAVGRLRRRADTAEYALEQRLRDLAYLADLIGVGIVRMTDDLRIEVANTAAHQFLELEPGFMLGRTAIEAFGDHRVEALAREAAERGASAGEVTLRNADGPTLVVRARRSPILGIWIVLEDVAELRRLQRIRAEFIDNLSHELRTPITTIGLLAETLGRDAAAAGDAIPGRMRERIGKLEVETGTIAQMIGELLDLAQIESGGRQLHLDSVDLGALAEQTVERLRPFADRQHIRLEARVGPDVPAVAGEAAQLGQVLANLIHNALKFSPPDSVVTVSVRGVDEAVEASVADQGMGIATLDLPRIFERFYKADRSRSAGGGTGLGLSIARHIIEGHRGQLTVQSKEGQGATFTMTLPLAGGAAETAGSRGR